MPAACAALLRQLRDTLDLDALTVTGKTLGETIGSARDL